MIAEKATALGWLFSGMVVVAVLGLLVLLIVDVMAERREDRTALAAELKEKPRR